MPIDTEELYDVVASEYGCYRYDEFIELVTPRQAYRFVDIISIRQHNNYVRQAMLTDPKAKKHLIKPKKVIQSEHKANNFSDEQSKKIDKALQAKLLELKNGT